MKILIVSDSHDRADALAEAVREAKAQGAEAVIHCGDLIGAQTLKPAIGLRGYDEIPTIEEIWGQALQKVDGKVAELKQLSKTNRGGARRELELLLEGVEGTDAEARVRAAIDELK